MTVPENAARARMIPAPGSLGATIEGIDLRTVGTPLMRQITTWLGERGVLRFPRQELDAADLKRFSAGLGDLEINVVRAFQEPDHPEVMLLSNMVENGRPVGLADAGQSWHADMSYSAMVAFANVLYALRVPQRDGRPLGATEFCDVAAAYDDLPDATKRAVEGRTATHDFNKFWDMMRARPGSTRAALTPEQRAAKPPVSHPLVIRHPISGRKVLYADPGYTVRIDGVSDAESARLLDQLFEHQTRDPYRYAFHWTVGDVLVWDNLRVIHRAVADYGPDEPRLMKRCQVMATRFAPLRV